jgi:hypothetical protein
MSADDSTQDQLNQLQANLTLGSQPSLFGIQAPPDPDKVQALLGLLKQTQYQQQANAPTGGQYGYLHDAGKQQFNSVGQQLGQALGNAIPMTQPGQPAPQSVINQIYGQGSQPSQSAAGATSGGPSATGVPTGAADPNAPSAMAPLTSQQAIGAALQKGKQIYQAQIAANIAPDVAKVNTLQFLVSTGVPGADAALDTANDAVLKNAQTVASTAKDSSQSKMDDSDITKNDIENKSKSWQTIYTDPNGFFQLQKSGTGEVKRTELAPNVAATVQADPQTEANIAAAIKSGQLPPLSGAALRTPSGQRIMGAVTADGTYDSTNFAAKAKAMNSFSTGPQGQAVKSFNVALSHLDTLGQAASALNNGDLKGVNQMGNAISSWTGNTAPTDFNAVKGIVGDEVTKAILGSGGGVADRQEAKATIDAANSPAQLQSVVQKYQGLMAGQLAGLRTQYESSTGRQDFESKLEPRAIAIAHSSPAYTSVFPNPAPSGATAPPANNTGASTAKPKLIYNPSTGAFN